MKPIFISRKICSAFQFATLLMFGNLLVGCGVGVSVPPKTVAPTPEPILPPAKPVVLPAKPVPPTKPIAPPEVRSAPAQTIRIILYFRQPTVNSKQLATAVAEACRCQPAFFRQYRDDALIYIIGLPQDISYAVFENTLLKNAAGLGIKSIEQDRVEHI